MNFPIPRIVSSTLSQAIEAGCDCVMPKYDGWPVLVNCLGEGCIIYSAITKQGQLRETTPISYRDLSRLETLEHIAPREPLTALLVGAKARDNPVVRIYDMWWFDGQDIQEFTYRNRYALARSNLRKLDERFVMIPTYPIQAAHALWLDAQKDPEHIKGLVFRRSKDTAAGELYVRPYYKESPEELV